MMLDDQDPWDKQTIILMTFVSLRIAGILLVIFNAIYLDCTRGRGSVRVDSTNSFPERCCKLRSRTLCNLMVLFNVVLLAAELIAALVFSIPSVSHKVFFNPFWLYIFVDYILLSCLFVPVARCIGTWGSHSHIGCTHALSLFECVNFVIFWTVVLLMMSSYGDHHFVIQPFEILASPYGFVPLVISYIVLLYGAHQNYPSFRIFKTMITKTEAVTKMRKALEDRPSVTWHIKCVRDGDNGK